MRYIGGDDEFELWLHRGISWIRDVKTRKWTMMKRAPLDVFSAKELEEERTKARLLMARLTDENS